MNMDIGNAGGDRAHRQRQEARLARQPRASRHAQPGPRQAGHSAGWPGPQHRRPSLSAPATADRPYRSLPVCHRQPNRSRRNARSASSPWAARVTRWTPRSSRPGWRRRLDAGRRAEAADVVLVNTCGFIEAAKKDSIDALLDAAGRRGGRKVVAVGLPGRAVRQRARRRAARGRRCSASTTTPTSAPGSTTSWPGNGGPRTSPRDRRTLLPITPAARAGGPGPSAARARQPGIRTCRPGSPRRPARGRCGAGWPAARWPR